MPAQTPTLKSDGSATSTAMSDQGELSDLFAERNLWELYRQSKPFYRNPFNRNVSIIGAILLGGFAIMHFTRLGATSTNRLDFPTLFIA